MVYRHYNGVIKAYRREIGRAQNNVRVASVALDEATYIINTCCDPDKLDAYVRERNQNKVVH